MWVTCILSWVWLYTKGWHYETSCPWCYWWSSEISSIPRIRIDCVCTVCDILFVVVIHIESSGSSRAKDYEIWVFDDKFRACRWGNCPCGTESIDWRWSICVWCDDSSLSYRCCVCRVLNDSDLKIAILVCKKRWVTSWCLSRYRWRSYCCSWESYSVYV